MSWIDCHVHSCHSHDSQQTLDQICRSAVERGLSGVCITDHADMWFLEQDHTFQQIAASVEEARAADAQWRGRLQIFSGMELSEYQDDPENAARLLALNDYDIVVGSVHSIRFEEWDDSYSRICFDETVPEKKVRAFLQLYFDYVAHMAEREDLDVLAHLTCPLRYINGKYRRGIGLEAFSAQIDQILERVIARGLSLEVNTSGIGAPYGKVMPDWEILERYHAMGGRRLTLGSDAHEPERIGNAFAETSRRLQAIGFDSLRYYERRQERQMPFPAL